MDVPCPKCNSIDLGKVSSVCEEVPYRCDIRAQFYGVLVGSAEVGTCRICKKTSAHLLSFETFVVQIPVATAASKSLLAACQQNRAAGRTFRAEL
jgi:hypothetical protein